MSRSILDRNDPYFGANKALTRMRYLDLQAAVVVRGMDFKDVVEGDHNTLATWFRKNYDNKQLRERLESFDQWMDEQLKENGHKKSSPLRKFRRFSSLNANNDVKIKTKGLRRAAIPKKKKEKRERDKQFKIFKGTKKDLTYQLTKGLFDFKKPLLDDGTLTLKELQKKYGDKMVSKVLDKFPDAKDKSVKIWMKRCLDALVKNKA